MNIRGLTRKEVRKLKKDGFNLMKAPDPGNLDGFVDSVLEIVLTKDDLKKLDDECFSEALAVFKQINDLTFGNKAAEKN